MADWKFIGAATFGQDIDATSTTENVPVGTVAQAKDVSADVDSVGTFIYLLGVASTAVGDLVTYDGDSFATTRASANGVGPCAVAMSANVANQYGWYCISGTVDITSGDVADAAALYLTSTAGSVDDAVVAGDLIYNAYAVAADAGGTTLSRIDRPFVNNVSN